MNYGISSFDLDFVSTKIKFQKEYLNSQNFITSSGSVKSLMDVNMNANLSTRYYAQLLNKVNTLQQIMSNENLTPVFLTITLHGWMHDLHYGDYSRFDDVFLCKLPENEKYGYLRTKALRRELFDVHDLYMVLRWSWDKFTSTRPYKAMKKTSKIGYLFATEPHKSGVPHAHVLLYVPAQDIYKLKKDFCKIFDAPMNITQDESRLSSEQIINGELNGFQWSLSNPVGYILKYVTKSFIDLQKQTDIDELQAWYIKHRIVRFTTSHTLVPQWVYNKVYPLENDWLYLSELKNNASCEWSHDDDYFKFEDENMDKTLIYNRGLFQMFINGTLEREFGEYKEPEPINTMRKRDKFIIRPKNHQFSFLPLDRFK
jgi:glycine cleavage system regulatory protein